jgi:hypothetical protein
VIGFKLITRAQSRNSKVGALAKTSSAWHTLGFAKSSIAHFELAKNISTELRRRCQTRIATSTPQGSQDGCLSWSPVRHSRTFSRRLPQIADSSANKAAQYAFSRQHRKKGMISMSTYLRPYKYGSRPPYKETTTANIFRIESVILSTSKPMVPSKRACHTKSITARPV